MNKQYAELVKNTGILTIANFSSKILGFLLVPFYTSILSTEEYGITDLIFSTVQLIVPIFTMNVSDAVLRFSLEEDKDSTAVLLISLKYTSISIIPCLLLVIIATITGIYDANKVSWPLITLYYFSYALNQCLPTYAKGTDKVRETAVSGVISTLTTVLSYILFLVMLDTGITGYFLSNVLGQLTPVIYLSIKLNIGKTIRERRVRNCELEKRMLAYSLPLIMTNIGWWINNTSDRYIITYFYNISLNGLLSVAYKIPSILSVLAGVFIQAWQISAMKEYQKDGSKDFYTNVFIYLNLFLYYVGFVLIILTKPLAHLAFQNDFYEAWIFVPFLILSAIFTANAGYLSPIITSSYNTKAVALSTIYGAVANIILNIVLLKVIGPQGVTVATAISGFIIMNYRYHVVYDIIERKVFYEMAFLWSLLIIQCVIELHFIWYTEIALGVIVTIIFRKHIISIVHMVLKIMNKRGKENE